MPIIPLLWLLFGPKPLPMALLQILIVGAWIAFVIGRYRARGPVALWWLASSPGVILLEGVVIWGSVYTACHFNLNTYCP